MNMIARIRRKSASAVYLSGIRVKQMKVNNTPPAREPRDSTTYTKDREVILEYADTVWTIPTNKAPEKRQRITRDRTAVAAIVKRPVTSPG
jgi:hypothetical protein